MTTKRKPADRRLLFLLHRSAQAATWYANTRLEAQADIDHAIHWALGVPGVHLNTVGDLTLLPKVLDAAARFERRPPDDAMAAMAQSQRLTSLFGLST